MNVFLRGPLGHERWESRPADLMSRLLATDDWRTRLDIANEAFGPGAASYQSYRTVLQVRLGRYQEKQGMIMIDFGHALAADIIALGQPPNNFTHVVVKGA